MACQYGPTEEQYQKAILLQMLDHLREFDSDMSVCIECGGTGRVESFIPVCQKCYGLGKLITFRKNLLC